MDSGGFKGYSQKLKLLPKKFWIFISEDDDGIFWVKIIKTIEVEFHNSIDGYWLSFIAKYKRGDLVEIILNEFETIEKRKERMREILNQVD